MAPSFGVPFCSRNPFQRNNRISALPDFQLFHIRLHKKTTLFYNLILAAVLHFPSPINIRTMPIKNIDLATIKLVICMRGPREELMQSGEGGGG